MIRDEILADFVKEFPWIYGKKDKGHKDCTVIGNAWQKVIEKSKNPNFDTEVEQVTAQFASLQKHQQKTCNSQKKRKNLDRVQKTWKINGGR